MINSTITLHTSSRTTEFDWIPTDLMNQGIDKVLTDFIEYEEEITFKNKETADWIIEGGLEGQGTLSLAKALKDERRDINIRIYCIADDDTTIDLISVCYK